MVAHSVVAQTWSDRREIIAFGVSGSTSMRAFAQLVEENRCRLVDRDVDVRQVDIAEIAAYRKGAADPQSGKGNAADSNATTPARSQPADDARSESNLIDRLAGLRDSAQHPFEMVLIGKDGTVKARATRPVALHDFIAQIDTMPMRQAEIRRAGGSDIDC